MPNPKVTDFITPISTEDTYPTHKSIFGHGGFKSVGSIQERDAIPSGRLEPGCWVNVTGDNVYQYDITGWNIVTGLVNTTSFTGVITDGVSVTGDGLNNALSAIGTGSFTGVTSDSTLIGDGSSIPLSVSLSTDSNNILNTGTDGKIYSSGLHLGDEFNGSSGDELRWIEDEPQLTKKKVIYVSDFTGNNLSEKWDAALVGMASDISNINRGGILELPGGVNKIQRTLLVVKPGSYDGATARLMTGWTVRGGDNTIIYWDNNAGTGDFSNQAMMEIPMSNRMKVENIRFDGSLLGSSGGTAVTTGCIGLYLRPGFEWNGNTARGCQFHRLQFDDCQTGVYLGDHAGPDFTSFSFSNCRWSQCGVSMLLVGANVTTIKLENCSLNETQDYGVPLASVRLQRSSAFNFDAGEYKDPWGVSKGQDWTDGLIGIYPSGTPQWNLKVYDSTNEVTRHQSGYVSGNGACIGGGPQVELINCDTTLTASNGPHVAIDDRSCAFRVHGLRMEGTDGHVVKQSFIEGNSNLRQNTRFQSLLEGVTTSTNNNQPIVIEQTGSNPLYSAGAPLTVRNCTFTTTAILPDEDLNINRYLKYDGLVQTVTGSPGVAVRRYPHTALPTGDAGTSGNFLQTYGDGTTSWSEASNFSNSNLVFNASRSHDLSGNDLTILDSTQTSTIGLYPSGGTVGLELTPQTQRVGKISGGASLLVSQTGNFVSVEGSDLITTVGLKMMNPSQTRYVRLQSPAGLTIDQNYTWPTGYGVSGSVLSTDGGSGTGKLSWGVEETITGFGSTLSVRGGSRIDSSLGVVSGTLPNGTFMGLQKTIAMTNASNTGTITITNHLQGSNVNATFTGVNDTLSLLWNGNVWVTLFANASI